MTIRRRPSAVAAPLAVVQPVASPGPARASRELSVTLSLPHGAAGPSTEYERT